VFGNFVAFAKSIGMVALQLKKGQMSTVAEFVSVHCDVVAKKPENISFEEAAGLPLADLNALQALESVRIKKENRILIHAGSEGARNIATQYAKAKAAIVYTTTSGQNVEYVKGLSTDHVIDYKTEDYKRVANNLDIVFDTLGGDYTFDAFKIIKEGGKVTSIVCPADLDTAKQMGMTDYKLLEKLSKLIEEESAVYKHT
jgi:NADPH:quinone reductase-like Zn-dependent oxidoreductase